MQNNNEKFMLTQRRSLKKRFKIKVNYDHVEIMNENFLQRRRDETKAIEEVKSIAINAKFKIKKATKALNVKKKKDTTTLLTTFKELSMSMKNNYRDFILNNSQKINSGKINSSKKQYFMSSFVSILSFNESSFVNIRLFNFVNLTNESSLRFSFSFVNFIKKFDSMKRLVAKKFNQSREKKIVSKIMISAKIASIASKFDIQSIKSTRGRIIKHREYQYL